jgi:hypothetical protein
MAVSVWARGELLNWWADMESADEGECAFWVSIADMDMLRLRQLI